MEQPTQRVKNVTGIKNAILKHKKVWLTIDGKNWVYVRVLSGAALFINYGLSHERAAFGAGIRNIYDFLEVKHG